MCFIETQLRLCSPRKWDLNKSKRRLKMTFQRFFVFNSFDCLVVSLVQAYFRVSWVLLLTVDDDVGGNDNEENVLL